MGFPIIDTPARTECGGCDVCCDLFRIEWLDKPEKQKCKHLCASGCGVYDSRPDGCKEYECLYRSGYLSGDDSYRPDNLGILFEAADPEFLLARETRPGGFDGKKASATLKALSASVLVYMKTYDGPSFLIGPPGRVQEVMAERMKQHALISKP